MDSVLRAVAIYVFLVVIFRFAGKRALGNITTFDFVLLLIIGEATQNALLGNDGSMTNAFIVITTLVGLEVLLTVVKQRSTRVERLIDGVPVVLIDDGFLHRDRLEKLRVDEDDILEAAHHQLGLARLDQVRYAILERNGEISVIPYAAVLPRPA